MLGRQFNVTSSSQEHGGRIKAANFSSKAANLHRTTPSSPQGSVFTQWELKFTTQLTNSNLNLMRNQTKKTGQNSEGSPKHYMLSSLHFVLVASLIEILYHFCIFILVPSLSNFHRYLHSIVILIASYHRCIFICIASLSSLHLYPCCIFILVTSLSSLLLFILIAFLSLLHSYPCCIFILIASLSTLHPYPCCIFFRIASLSSLHLYPRCIFIL